MERQIKNAREWVDVWPDFWEWFRQQPEWDAMGRNERNYLFRTQTAYKKGGVGNERVKSLIKKYAPERYEFRGVFIVRE